MSTYTDRMKRKIAAEAMEVADNVNKVCKKYHVSRFQVNKWCEKFGIDKVRRASPSRLLDQDKMVEQVKQMISDGMLRKDAIKKLGITKGTFDRWLDNYNKNILEAGYRSPNYHLWKPTNLGNSLH